MSTLGREQSLLVVGCLMVLATVAVSFALYWTAPLMVPFVLSILVSYLVAPLVDWLQVHLRTPRSVAIAAAFVVIAGGAGLLTLLLWTSAQGLAENADVYRERINAFGFALQGWLEQIPEPWLPQGWSPEQLGVTAVLQAVDTRVMLTTLGTRASDLLGFLTSLVSNALLVTLFSVYLVSGRRPLEERPGLWGEIDRKVRAYLVTKFAVSAATGVAVWLILLLLGLDLALVFGVLAFLLNFIPNIGSIVATLLPLPVALMQFDSMGWVALVLLLPGAVQFVVGNVIEPTIMGESLDLHPITVLLTLIFWGLLWGPVGMLLATPMTAVICIVLARFDTTRPVAEVLAGRLSALHVSGDDADAAA